MAPLDGVVLHTVKSLADLDACRQWAGERRDGPLCADTESAGLSPYAHPMRLVQLGDLRHGWAFLPGWWGAAIEILHTYPGPLAMHHGAYDNRVLARHAGYTPRWADTGDTMLAAHIADSLKPAALKARAALDVDPRAMAGDAALGAGMKAQHWTWATVPCDFAPYTAYSALDPVLTAHLHRRFSGDMQRYRQAYDLELATARICAGMMDAGMMIDRAYIRERIGAIEGYVARASAWLREVYGITSVNASARVSRALEAAGVPTLVRTETGQPSISKDTLRMYMAAYPDQRDLLQAILWCRKADKLVNSYLQKFLDMAGSDDIMHYSINTCRARTSRQSVTDPPMQTFDRDEPAPRGAYIPRPGNVFVTVDADQIEMRKAAHFSRDARMIADFHEADRSGQSFFVIAASRIYGEKISKKDPRYTRAKNASYGQLYGAGLEKAAITAGVPVEQMRPIYMGFQQAYPGVSELMNRLIHDGKATSRPYATAIDGRKLYVHRGHEYAILNTMIQGSAAVTLKRGLVALDAAGYGPYMRLPLHDEILLEVPAEHGAEALADVTRILEDRDSYRVPLTWAGSVLESRWRKT